MDTKVHVYIYDSRFNDHEQAQIATTKMDNRNRLVVIGCLLDIDIDINKFCKYIKISIQTKRCNSLEWLNELRETSKGKIRK